MIEIAYKQYKKGCFIRKSVSIVYKLFTCLPKFNSSGGI